MSETYKIRGETKLKVIGGRPAVITRCRNMGCSSYGEYTVEQVTSWAEDGNGIARPVGSYFRCSRCGGLHEW